MKPSTHHLRLLFFLFLPAWAAAQEAGPELSADQPIAYTADNGILIATGNAVYRDANTQVEADQIRYDRNRNQVEATGNVRVNRDGLRLLTAHLSYDANEKTFVAGRFRAGYPPLFIEGESFSGTLDQIDFSKVSLYLREPVAGSPRIEIDQGRWISGESVSGSGLRLRTLGALAIPLPAFEYGIGSPTMDVSATAGFRNGLGAYLDSRVLYPFSSQLDAGANIGLFSKRGVLVGPVMEWTGSGGLFRAWIDTGWIHDHNSSERGSDILGNRIEQDRGFAGAGLQARNAGSLQFQARATYLSDSEVIRDFRRDVYFPQYQPDHFADFTWQQDNLLLNVFGRVQINDSYGMVERLPEIRAEWLPQEIAATGIYLQAAAASVRYRLQEVVPASISVLFPANPLGLPGPESVAGSGIADLVDSPVHNRLDGTLTLSRPFRLAAGTDLVLRAGGRWSSYHREGDDMVSSLTEDRWVGELGFDLARTVARTWRVDRPGWNMERLRHVSRAQVQYRWHPGGDDRPEAMPPFDLFPYHARRPVLDLADLNHIDGLRDWNIARFGWENLLMVADAGAPFREFLAVNLYQDLLFSADAGEDEWDALYGEVDFTPFPWLTLQWRQKFTTEEAEMESSFLRVTLRSADLWSLGLQAEYLRNAIEQYELSGRYRLTENLGLIGYWHYDARLSSMTRQQYGFSRRFGNTWQLECYVAFNNDNAREDDFSVGLRVLWLSF